MTVPEALRVDTDGGIKPDMAFLALLAAVLPAYFGLFAFSFSGQRGLSDRSKDGEGANYHFYSEKIFFHRLYTLEPLTRRCFIKIESTSSRSGFRNRVPRAKDFKLSGVSFS